MSAKVPPFPLKKGQEDSIRIIQRLFFYFVFNFLGKTDCRWPNNGRNPGSWFLSVLVLFVFDFSADGAAVHSVPALIKQILLLCNDML